MTWEPELDELARRRERIHEMGAEGRVARHVPAGRKPVRERIRLLLDPGSFRETGSVARKVEHDTRGLNGSGMRP